MTDAARQIADLSQRLNPLDARPDDLPVHGYIPPGDSWRPRPAAVLIPILLEPSPCVILTVRSPGMASHAGQVALPGGGRSGDEGFPLQTALREASEEIGILRDQVRVVGLLDGFDTISAWRVIPVVGVLSAPVHLQPCSREVREIFSLPLNQVLDPGSYRRHVVTRGGHDFDMYSMASGIRTVWGATAAILQDLARRA
jgi:8-oxo-dGTP pyrophosphatase MutT (NUDIX family)